jgi:signal transduction histidine kinase
VLILLLHQFDGDTAYDSGLLLPLVLLLASEQDKLRAFAAVLALVTLIVMLVIAPSYSFALWWFLSTLLLYLNVRAITIYKDANHLSRLHLQELTEAHEELAHTHKALQEASVYAVRYVGLTERMRVARDMHDGIGHHLTTLIVQLQALEMMLPEDAQRAADTIPTLLKNAREAMSEVRQAVRNSQEDESGLGVVALRGLVSQCEEHTRFAISFQQGEDLSDWPIEVSLVLYRVLQEALTNAVRHAQASAVEVKVWEQEHRIMLTVADNGCYSTSVGLVPGFGIKSMLERCQALGGSCMLAQNKESGLKLLVELPTILPVQGEEILPLLPNMNGAPLFFSER